MKKILPLFLLLSLIWSCDKTGADATSAMAAAGGNGSGGSLARFTLFGNFLYTVDKQSLRVYDVSNPAQPVFRRTVPVGFDVETIYPFKDKLFIGSTTVVHIFDITDPAAPQKLAEAISPEVMRRCDPVVAKDTVAFATLRTDGPCGGTQSILAVYDIKDATKPKQRGSAPVNAPYGLGYSDNALYVCSATEGLVVFDISAAYTPVRKRQVLAGNSRFIDVIPYGNVLVCWLHDGLALYDISDRFTPVLIKKIV